MAKKRAFGVDAILLADFESSYGVVPAAGNYLALPFKSYGVGADQPLGYDPLLGQGRDDQDPHYEAVSVDGQVEVPMDVQALGNWLKGLYGAPASTAVAARGKITFTAQPADTETLTINGTPWTFVSGAPTGDETQIGGSLSATLDQLVTDLNASVDTEIDDATYSHPADSTEYLLITHDTAGTAGNAFTMAEAVATATVSAATLLGGGTSHVFTSGGDNLPSLTLEAGHPKLVTPVFFRHFGAKLETLAISMARSGPANATIGIVAQGETEAGATIDGAPTSYTVSRFFNSKGAILKGGSQLASVVGGGLTFSNNLERDETIRPDDLIDGADETESSAAGTVDLRFGPDSGIDTAAVGKTAVAMKYTFAHSKAWSLEFDLPRVFFPRKKKELSGPGGVQASYEWRAAKDASAGYLLRVTLVNDVASY